MDHLNLFNPYRNKSSNHEDELTRAFLILLKNIPLVQMMFFDMVSKELSEYNIGSISLGGLFIEEVFTQISNNNDIFKNESANGRNLISIIISDDSFLTETKVTDDTRQARYDGVVFCEPNWCFIIENKPNKDNIWLRQLNPNIPSESEIKVFEKPCCLSWRHILSTITELVSKGLVNGSDRVLIEDFIEYVDSEYSWINPFTKFNVCKNNIYLLNRRCISIMENYNSESKEQVQYHKGWKYYINSGCTIIKQIALDAEQSNDDWVISLWLYAGDTMLSSRETYNKLNIDKLLSLKKIGFNITTNFHVSYQSSGLVGDDKKNEDYLKIYVEYWKNNYVQLKQVKKDEYDNYFNKLKSDGIIDENFINKLKEKVFNKRYEKLNICPGLLIKYTWESSRAIELDDKNKFTDDFREKINLAFDVFK